MMVPLEQRAAMRLTPVLGRLKEQGYVNDFSLEPYVKDQDISSPRYPLCIEPFYQGVFIAARVHDKTFHLDFEILRECKTWWCYRDDQFELSHDFVRIYYDGKPPLPSDVDPLEFASYGLMQIESKRPIKWTGREEKPKQIYLMHPQRIYEIIVRDYIEESSQRIASHIMGRNNNIGAILSQAGALSLDLNQITEHLGQRRYTQSSRPTVYLGEEVEGYERTGQHQEEASEEQNTRRPNIFNSWVRWFEFLKDAFGIKTDYRVVGNKVYLDLPDQFQDVHEAFLADQIMNTREVERLILWDSMAESLEEKVLEEVKERDWENRVVETKIKPYLDFIQRHLNLQLPTLRVPQLTFG